MGWDFREEDYETTEPIVRYVVDETFTPMIQQVMQLEQESPSEYATNVPEEMKQAVILSQQQGVAVRPEVIGERTVTKTRTIKNCPTLEVCDYRNVILDSTCDGDIDKANFAIYSFNTSLSDLRKEGKKYSNLDEIVVQNNGPLNEPDHHSGEGAASYNFGDAPRTKIVVHEYWGMWDIDKTGITKPIVVAWCGNTIIRMEESPFPDKGLPFVVVQYLPVRGSTYGEPDGVLIEDNQKVMGAVTRGMMDIMAKSANGQTAMRKDMLDSVNKRKWQNGEDYEFNGNIDPRVGIHMHTYPEIPQSAQFMLQLQAMEAESLTGVKSFSQGMSGNSLGDVAAGVRGALDAASKRELGILRRISNGLMQIARKIISMNAIFLAPEEVIRVTNEEFVIVRRDDLGGNFDLKLGVSTAEEDDRKAQELAFMLQTMGNNMDPEMNKMILSDIARLRKMPELAKKIETYQPQPDPMQVRMQELQMALLEAQIATEQAKAASLGSTAQLSAVKTGTEMAKQGNIQADTDSKNLDFVEQESGVHQQRDLEKQGAQARAQANLALIQHTLDKDLQKSGAQSK